MSNRTFLRRLAAAVSVPVALLGTLASPTAAASAAAAPAMTPVAQEYAPLRVMPLGDSITFGVGSQRLDGYRPELYRRLTNAGLEVDFVGSLRSGDGRDADNEGHKGWTIKRLANHVDDWLATYQPDVILLHIGTNDLARRIPGAAGRLDALLDQIAADRPDAEVFVAQVTGLADYADVADQRERTAVYNRAVARIVAAKGERFHLVDQSGIHGIDMFNLLHPNDYGYKQMAWNWYRAMEPVLGEGGAAWPVTADPYQAPASLRCVDHSILDPAVVGCHYWYRRVALGAQTWAMPVHERVRYRVRVNGRIVVRVRITTRWVIAA